MLRRFFRNADGNVAMIFALAMIPVIVAAGGAIDYTRGEQLRTTVQDALDAATLAAAREIGRLTETQIYERVDKYYLANIGDKIANPPSVTSKMAGATLDTEVTVVSPNSFLGIIGLNDFTYHLKAQVTSGIGTLEIALVLDNSTSMSGSKISTLKTAAGDLVETLFGLGSTSTKADPIKISVVPFAGAVNVGASNRTATWIDSTAVGTYHADSIEKAHYDTYGTTTSVNAFTLFDAMGVAWGGCVEARPIPYDASDDTPATATPGTMFAPMFAPDEPDDWTCSTSSCTYAGSSSARRYIGAPTGRQDFNNYLPDVAAPTYCGDTVTMTIANPGVITKASHGLKVGDRVVFGTSGKLPGGITAGTMYYVKQVKTADTFTISSSSGGSAIKTTGSQNGVHKMTSSAMWVCANNSADCNGTNNGVTDKAAFARTCKYNQTPVTLTVNNFLAGGPNMSCTTKAITPLSTSETTVTSAITAMAASGSTNIGEGVGWGWRTLSPTEPFTGGRSYSDDENQKIMVVMSDGENTYFPDSTPFTKSLYGAWGFVWNSHLGTTSTDTDTLTTKMNERTLEACTNAKAAGVKIYTVGFEINAGTTNDPSAAITLLKNCASDVSMYYDAANESELLAAFTAIGDSITSLRVSK